MPTSTTGATKTAWTATVTICHPDTMPDSVQPATPPTVGSRSRTTTAVPGCAQDCHTGECARERSLQRRMRDLPRRRILGRGQLQPRQRHHTAPPATTMICLTDTIPMRVLRVTRPRVGSSRTVFSTTALRATPRPGTGPVSVRSVTKVSSIGTCTRSITRAAVTPTASRATREPAGHPRGPVFQVSHHRWLAGHDHGVARSPSLGRRTAGTAGSTAPTAAVSGFDCGTR